MYAAAAQTEYEDGQIYSVEAAGKVIVGSIAFFENFATLFYHYGKIGYSDQTVENNQALAIGNAVKEGDFFNLAQEGLVHQGERLIQGDPMVIGELVTAACVATDVTSSIRATTGTIAVPTSIGSTPGVAGALQVSTVSVTVPVVSGAGTATAAGTSYTMMMAGNRRKPGNKSNFKSTAQRKNIEEYARHLRNKLTGRQREIFHKAIQEAKTGGQSLLSNEDLDWIYEYAKGFRP